MTVQKLIDALNKVKNKTDDIKYLVLEIILKCLMKVFKIKEDELREAFIKTWKIEYDKRRSNNRSWYRIFYTE